MSEGFNPKRQISDDQPPVSSKLPFPLPSTSISTPYYIAFYLFISFFVKNVYIEHKPW